MKLVPGPNGWPQAYALWSRRSLAANFASHVFQSARDHYGLSPLEAAAIAFDTHNAAACWNKALLDNAARPSGALVYDGGEGAVLSTLQYERLKKEFADHYQGHGNVGRPLVLEWGLDWRPMSLTPRDFLEAKHAAAREIALAFGVPPMLLAIPGDNTYSNY
jgi:HK97 family phage portal protein